MTSFLAAGALAAAVVFAPAPAAAQAAPARTVGYAGLDLASPRDQARFDRRVARAVREVCGTPASFDLHGQAVARRCRTATAAALVDRRRAILAAAAQPAQVASLR
jgi:UrcA family protein